MSSLSIASTSAACIFGGSLLGMGLQRLLPGHHQWSDYVLLVFRCCNLRGLMGGLSACLNLFLPDSSGYVIGNMPGLGIEQSHVVQQNVLGLLERVIGDNLFGCFSMTS
jgi:hypothetical protein